MASSNSKLPKKEHLPPLPPPPQNPNPNPNPNPNGESSSSSPLSSASHLTREEVVRRRYRNTRKLLRIYRGQYWSLIEEIRAKHREYLWNVGASPEAEEDGGGERRTARARCVFGGCKSRAMPLSRFCHPHVLYDREQTLYKGCIYVTRSDVACNKPILRSVVPSLCPSHFQSTQKQLLKALKKAGVSMGSSSRATVDFNAIVLECVRNIQAKRKRRLAKRKMNATLENITETVNNEKALELASNFLAPSSEADVPSSAKFGSGLDYQYIHSLP